MFGSRGLPAGELTNIPQPIGLVTGLPPRCVAVEVAVDVADRIEPFIRTIPDHVTVIHSTRDNGTATEGAPVVLPSLENSTTPGGDEVGLGFRGHRISFQRTILALLWASSRKQ